MNVFSNFVPNKVVTFTDHRSPWIILNLKDKFKACVRYFFNYHYYYFLPNDSPSKTVKDVFYFI